MNNMADKINGFGHSPVDVSRSQAGAGGKADKAGEGQPTGGTRDAGDAVSITDAALTLKRVEASLSALPEVDAQRVATLRQQIDSGAYTINAENVADKLTRFERDFL